MMKNDYLRVGSRHGEDRRRGAMLFFIFFYLYPDLFYR